MFFDTDIDRELFKLDNVVLNGKAVRKNNCNIKIERAFIIKKMQENDYGYLLGLQIKCRAVTFLRKTKCVTADYKILVKKCGM